MKPKKKHPKRNSWVAVGIDTSLSSLAAAAIGYDSVLRKHMGPSFALVRWQKGTDYFERLRDASKSHELILDLIAGLKMTPELSEVFIAQEEPFPPHTSFMKKGISAAMKQQAEISGAVLGSLLRWGYREIVQIGSHSWRQVIASDLEISIHHSKWLDPELALVYNCKPSDTGKFRAKQWACNPGYAFQGIYSDEVPDWPDIINSKHGKIPRPENSNAKAIQCDDRYEALAMADWMRQELGRLGIAS